MFYLWTTSLWTTINVAGARLVLTNSLCTSQTYFHLAIKMFKSSFQHVLLALYMLINSLEISAIDFSGISPPPELFSSLVEQKVLHIAQNEPSPPMYPQYTDRVQGIWQYFNVNNTWTTGFFPATLYALNTRDTLCNKGSIADWVQLGGSWSAGIVPFEKVNGLEHDVGFVSFPFQEELLL